MPKTKEYVRRSSKDGVFSCKISKDVNQMLDIYCRLTKRNKTTFVNAVMREKLESIFGDLVSDVQVKLDV